MGVGVKEGEEDVIVTINNKVLATIKSKLPFNARGGVMVINGYKNIVSFKNFTIGIQDTKNSTIGIKEDVKTTAASSGSSEIKGVPDDERNRL